MAGHCGRKTGFKCHEPCRCQTMSKTKWVVWKSITSLGVLWAAHRKIHCSVAVIWVQVSGWHSLWGTTKQHHYTKFTFNFFFFHALCCISIRIFLVLLYFKCQMTCLKSGKIMVLHFHRKQIFNRVINVYDSPATPNKGPSMKKWMHFFDLTEQPILASKKENRDLSLTCSFTASPFSSRQNCLQWNKRGITKDEALIHSLIQLNSASI